MYGFIYMTTNLINGKRYIGKHKYNGRENSYIGSGILLKKAIEKYGKENFKREILVECATYETLNEMEKYYIEKYDACNNKMFYNIATGGEGGDITVGMTKERYEEYCEKFRGENNPMYGTKRLGKEAPMYGKKLTDEHKKKISESRMGLTQTQETREKISKTFKEKYRKNGHHLAMKIASLNKDKQIIKEFNSMGDAAKYYNTYTTKVSRMCKTGTFDKELQVYFSKL